MKIDSGFWFKKFHFKSAQVSKIGFKILAKILAGKRFHLAKSVFHGLRFVFQNQVSEIGFKVFSKSFASLVRAFLPGSFSLAIFVLGKVSF